MGKRYAIWDKQEEIITPSGEVFTAEQWMERYPAFKLNRITAICAAGEINGGIAETLGSLVQMYETRGIDFSNCNSAEEKLELIEAFEDAEQARIMEEAQMAAINATIQTNSLASIAAQLEYQNMMTLPDEEE